MHRDCNAASAVMAHFYTYQTYILNKYRSSPPATAWLLKALYVCVQHRKLKEAHFTK